METKLTNYFKGRLSIELTAHLIEVRRDFISLSDAEIDRYEWRGSSAPGRRSRFQGATVRPLQTSLKSGRTREIRRYFLLVTVLTILNSSIL